MIQTECGIFGVISKNNMDINHVLNQLAKLQHRGRDCYGISYLNNTNKLLSIKNKGEVKKCINNGVGSYNVKSKSFLGHVRYSTSGLKDESSFNKYCQPFIINKPKYKYSIAHNGNIPEYIWDEITNKYNIYFKGETDTLKLVEYINHFLDNKYDYLKCLWKIVSDIKGAFCLVFQTTDNFYIVRDSYGIRPLSIAKIKDNSCVYISSESIAFPLENNEKLSDKYNIIDVSPGEMLQVSKKDLNILTKFKNIGRVSSCIFEYIYFLRDETITDGTKVSLFRKNIGEILAKQLINENPQLWDKIKNDNNTNDILVCGVPTSGITYGKSMAESLNLQYNQYLKKRSDYPWRTFILENNDKRLAACQKKYIVEGELIKDKIIILVDDSIVRGNTIKYLVKYIKSFQPKEIHFVTGCPPIKYPCRYGVDFPDIEELIANKISVEKLAANIGVNSLTYLDLAKLLKIKQNVCNACFTGSYPF